MQNVLEPVAITILCIVLLCCIGRMLDIAYNVAEYGAVAAWHWVQREVRIAGLRGDIHGYDVDMAYLLKAAPFDARTYCQLAAQRHAAADELAELLAGKHPQQDETESLL